MNLNQVSLPALNMKDSVEFYCKLGFILIVDTPHYARFECPIGSSTFSLFLQTASFENSSVIYFEHEQLDKWVDELTEKGIVFIQLPQDKSYLWREAILKDPSNNKVKLYWAGENRKYPPWRVSDT